MPNSSQQLGPSNSPKLGIHVPQAEMSELGTIVELKRIWSQKQTLCQQGRKQIFDSSWNIKQTDSWCGWLLMRRYGPFAKWKSGWLELGLESDSDRRALLHFYPSNRNPDNKDIRILHVRSIQRRPELDSHAAFVVSIGVVGWYGTTLLASASDSAINELERKISHKLCPSGNTSLDVSPSLTLAARDRANLFEDPATRTVPQESAFPNTFVRVPSRDSQNDCWCGWLLKRTRGPFGSWRRRWFELRRQPSSLPSAARSKRGTPLFYYAWAGGLGPRRLEVTGARREAGLDCAAGAVLSVEAAGRRGRTLLAAGSAAEAERIVRELTLRLPGGGGLPPSPSGGTARAAARAC